jgi:Na+/proline symporter
MTVCGSIVAQEIIARILSTRSPTIARRATLFGGGMYLGLGLIPAFLGLIGTQLLPNLADPEQVLPRLAKQYLPVLLYVLFTGALVSAILSTVDSTLLAASSLVAHNLIVSFRPQMPDHSKLKIARAGVILFGLLAYGLALGAESIFELVQQANGVGSAGIFVLMVFGLFSGFGGPRTGFVTLLAGLGTWIYGTYFGAWEYTYLISLGAALVAFVVVGSFERRPCGMGHAAG